MLSPNRLLPKLSALAWCAFFDITPGVAVTSTNCGPNTFFDETSDACVCNADQLQSNVHVDRKLSGNDIIRLLGLIDLDNWDWGKELFDYTMLMINDPSDGWRDGILDNSTYLEWDVQNAACDGNVASRAYWEYRTRHGGVPPHGLVGCRCSDASVAVANVAGLEGVTQVSPASTFEDLSDKGDYPFFARTVSSASHVTGAIVSMLRGFDWDRVSIIQTDTAYSNSLSTSFQQLWTGEHEDESGEWRGDIAYSHNVVLDQDGSVNQESVRKALEGVPTEDPTKNSRVIMLFAHDQHAFPILEIANGMGFQPDTIWIGVPAWAGRYPSAETLWFLSNFNQGYLGITPYRNRNEDYHSFLHALQERQIRDGKLPWEELPDYAAEQLVDSMLALVMALVATDPQERRDGNAVISNLLNLDFAGVSGQVRFTPDGDREDPLFSILNFWNASWVDVGTAGSDVGSSEFDMSKICWAVFGCGLETAPAGTYPVPEPLPHKLARWIPAVISIIALLLVGVTLRYMYVARKKKELDSQMSEIQRKMEAMRNIDNQLDDAINVVELAKKRQAFLIEKRAALQETPSTWTDSLRTLVPVSSDDEEYWSVLSMMQKTIPNVHISKLWRVQNPSLWSYYSFHKDRLVSNRIDPDEKRVWHGTSGLDPSAIYNDQMDGFMMQFAAQGLWGRGIYFADKASYSRNYSHTPTQSVQTNERPIPKNGELEMFLTRLLVGNEVQLPQNSSLTVPPANASNPGLKYNTVTGHTNGSQVWIVYENGRAYPEYLIRYYVGGRDSARSQYASKKEAMKSARWSKCDFELNSSSISNGQPEAALPNGQTNKADRQGFWEYLSDSGWTAYDGTNQALIEKAYQDFSGGKSKTSIAKIQGPQWEYEINVDTMVQTNVQHTDSTQRQVRFQSTLV